MANINAVSSAIGTQRQFAKQPQDLYQMQLIRGNYMAGINQRSDLDAQALISALKDFGVSVWNEYVAEDKRKQEQATLVKADKLLAGKTKEDLKAFDRITALQHAGDDAGFDLTDNKYAVAALDRDIGETLGEIAKSEWYSDSQTEHPKDVASAVQSFNKKMDDYFDEYVGGALNKTAFETGFTKGKNKAALQVAAEAHAQINDEARYKGQQTVRVSLNNLALNILDNKMTHEEIKGTFDTTLRKLQSYCKTPKEAVNIISEFLDSVSDNEITNEKIKLFKEAKLWGDSTVGDLIPMYKYRQKMAANYTKRQAKWIFEQCVRPDGTIDEAKYRKLKEGIPKSILGRKVPKRDIPLSEGDNPDMNINPKLKEAVPLIGGILSNMGYGDTMQITSGYRDEERNRQAGGVANSKHLTGNALDIYLGKLDKSEAENVLAAFRPYFDFVTYHDAGSGMHLHLQEYNGGLDGAGEDENEVTGSAYAPERSSDIDKIVTNLSRDAQRKHEEEYKKVKKTAIIEAYNASSLNESFEKIDKLPLTPKDKKLYKQEMINYYNAQDAVNKGIAKKDLAAITSYMHPMSAHNIWDDEATIAEYSKKKFKTSTEEKEYNKAMVRFNWYVNKVMEQNPNISRDLAKVAHYNYNFSNTDGEESAESGGDSTNYDFNFSNTDGEENEQVLPSAKNQENYPSTSNTPASKTATAVISNNDAEAPQMTPEESKKVDDLKDSLKNRVFDNDATRKAVIIEVAKELGIRKEIVDYYILKEVNK